MNLDSESEIAFELLVQFHSDNRRSEDSNKTAYFAVIRQCTEGQL
jgi:hypothetical protein